MTSLDSIMMPIASKECSTALPLDLLLQSDRVCNAMLGGVIIQKYCYTIHPLVLIML